MLAVKIVVTAVALTGTSWLLLGGIEIGTGGGWRRGALATDGSRGVARRNRRSRIIVGDTGTTSSEVGAGPVEPDQALVMLTATTSLYLVLVGGGWILSTELLLKFRCVLDQWRAAATTSTGDLFVYRERRAATTLFTTTATAATGLLLLLLELKRLLLKLYVVVRKEVLVCGVVAILR